MCIKPAQVVQNLPYINFFEEQMCNESSIERKYVYIICSPDMF